MKNFLVLLVALLFSFNAAATDGYKIKVKIKDFEGKELMLGYHYGDKQYIQDTVTVGEDGFYTFVGDEPLPGGVYLLVMPPDNNIIQLLINEEEQNFTFVTSSDDPFAVPEIKNSKENELFYQYMKFLGEKRKEAEPINASMQEAADDKTKKELQQKMEGITLDVENRQNEILKDHPKSLTALIIKASQDIPSPQLDKNSKDYDKNRWLYYKAHWFDNLNLADDRLLRGPLMFQKIDQYMKNVIVQHPDSISLAIDNILEMMPKDGENFKYFLIHFLNTYAKSKIVGMDAVYVHLVDKYYATGLAPWTEKEQLQKIVKNAEKLKPLLLGNTAPEIKVYKQDGSPLSLHELKADYTVLFFWDPDCGHCKKSMPDLIDFYNKYKEKGVKVLAVCTKLGKDEEKCWDSIKEHNMDIWINTSDKYLRSKFKTLYDVQTTPQIFVLDENKEIISKRIGASQLEEVIEKLIKIKKDKEALTVD